MARNSLPPEYVTLDGERLRTDLRGRRDRLVEGARSFYEHLAGQVDIQASNAAEQISVTHGPDGTMPVEVRDLGASEPVFSRRFDPKETRDVRVYLRDGDDQIQVVGKPGRRV